MRRKMQKKITNVNEGQPGLNEEEAQGVGEPKVETEELRDAEHEIGTEEQRNTEPDVETEEQRDTAMSQNFLRFLSEFKQEGARAPYFEGQVKALHYCGNFVMNVSFDDLENYSKQNARYICYNSPRVSERLRLCLCEYLLRHEEFKMMSGEVAEKIRLQIIGLPAPNRFDLYYLKSSTAANQWALTVIF
uniref:MCM N-terminal domain-containing protein n=1 Tax=Oryza punctata TaxID=4537 RepID=A0A0E0KEQ1_ORYPU